MRMLPVFLVPATAYGLYMALSWVLRWVEIRDRARLTGLQAKLKKMLNELKVSHHESFRLSSTSGHPEQELRQTCEQSDSRPA